MRSGSWCGTWLFPQTCRGAKKVCVSVPQFPIEGWMAVLESNESPLWEKGPGESLQGARSAWGCEPP